MNTKDRILALLEAKRGHMVSGEYIAEQLNISRSAVWKAINGLKSKGYRIEAATNNGYCLMTDNDILSVAGMLPFLDSGGSHIQVYQRVDSTNTMAKALAAEGAEHGTLVIADEQTAGRGRYGRSFF